MKEWEKNAKHIALIRKIGKLFGRPHLPRRMGDKLDQMIEDHQLDVMDAKVFVDD